MKKRKRKKGKTIFVLLILFFIFIMIKQVMQVSIIEESSSIISNDPFEDAKKYSPIIRDELEKYHLEEYTTVLLALMQQESRGKGGDPMQASESAGLAPNTIKDPKQSIKQGVNHFQRAVTYGNQKKVDFPTIIQAYNMGIGYIDYAAQHGGKHTEELAKKFSLLQVNKKPKVYNCGGNKNNFRYPYCYGDFTYSTKVAKNIESIADSVPVNSGTADEAF
ncbi:hypothetical protein ELQ35_14840 [Peribacillus cavernae]|uniref:CwlT-like lysozyme domain-containing protein n=1 Tax=Peribacillus cavernae TaxID=1674310 RepID=A0A433HHT7_9BACI|nr:lysozyme family protein [Peribacillus cavernae]MDQ0219310.1 hypothetical protein [Peribacillus cavernae]RUQ27805.1 hypothetical protein ELQ35_14840 [Peribacillus cavernae]